MVLDNDDNVVARHGIDYIADYTAVRTIVSVGRQRDDVIDFIGPVDQLAIAQIAVDVEEIDVLAKESRAETIQIKARVQLWCGIGFIGGRFAIGSGIVLACGKRRERYWEDVGRTKAKVHIARSICDDDLHHIDGQNPRRAAHVKGLDPVDCDKGIG